MPKRRNWSHDVDYKLVPAATGGGIVPEGRQLADSWLLRLARASSGLLPWLPQALSSRLLITLQKQGGPPATTTAGITCERDEPAGVPTYWLAPESRPQGTIVFLHGGGYLQGPDNGQWSWLARLCQQVGVAGAAVLYRMPPRHPFPQALEDAVAAITALQADGHLRPGNWILAGDSAGGGLALATAQALAERSLAEPAGLLLTAPWVDLELTNPDTEDQDPMMTTSFLRWCAQLYADGTALADPRLSPTNGNVRGLPPVHLNVGTRDLLQPDVRRLREKLERAGVTVTFIEQEGAVHTYPQLPGAAGEWTVRNQIQWAKDLLAAI